RAVTPLALNPCIDYSEKPNYPGGEKDTDYSGYNRRWLMFDDRPAISPFTVKSAVANAYANLMGGCYRVNTIVEKHRDLEKGQYPYVGAYKRYRVAMDGSSKPGIILEIKEIEDGSRYVKIQPVKEFYMDIEMKNDLKRGAEVRLSREKIDRGHRPPIVRLSSSGEIKAKYHGRYHYGMNLSNPEGKKHKHRFYQEAGEPVEGVVRRENFLSEDDLKRYVYIGGRDQNNKKIPVWYEDLTTLKEGDFVYYEMFGGRVCNIGKNFLFKALFLHEDTIPPGNETCRRLDALCLRCSLFGMTAEDSDVSGFRGRFLASTLIADKVVRRVKEKSTIPVKEGGRTGVDVISLKDDAGNELGRQFLLPILGPPKPNKRDVDGYFNKNTGHLKGAKVYRHTKMTRDGFEELIKRTDSAKIKMGKNTSEYSHNLRNWAEVLYEGITFSGTVGVENCTPNEAAALAFLLHSPLSGHGYKLGLGKSVGLGSVSSRIKRLWVRDAVNYTWKEITTGEDLKNALEKAGMENVAENIDLLRKSEQALNLLHEDDKPLHFPEAGLHYWKEFNKMQ
ncbi:MAG: hypothetical protein D6726_11555, partial [Nitrospirae bacterium]